MLLNIKYYKTFYTHYIQMYVSHAKGYALIQTYFLNFLHFL